MQPTLPDHLHSFYTNWAAVLHKIHPEFTPNHVVSQYLDTTANNDGNTTDYSVVFLKLSQQYALLVEDFFRSGGSGIKDSNRSDNIRLQGSQLLNEASGGRELMGVAEVFNRSLAYAEEESRAMFKAYEMRSVLCYNLEQFGLCLRNIEKALEDGEYGDLTSIMMLRSFCLGRGDGPQGTVDFADATLSKETNPIVPNAVAGIDLEISQGHGRYLVAKQCFDFGDTLLIDDPYVLVADLDQQYRQCHHCLKFCSLELLPCPGCVEVMFCSPECGKIAHQSYHRFECPILRNLYTLDKIGRMAIIVARIVFTTITMFNDDLDALRDYIDSIDKDLNPFKLNWTTTPHRDRYAAIYTLATNKGIRDPEANNSFSIVAFFAAQLILSKSPLMVTLANTQLKQNFIRELFWHHALTVGTSMRIANPDRSFGAYPLVSMINHGCSAVANVMRVGLPEGRIAIVATRTIAPGEPILEDYTFNLTDATHSERHRYLRLAYQIDNCQCPLPVPPPPVDEATRAWEEGIAQALNDLTEVEMKQCDQEDLAVLRERLPTLMRMLEPWPVGAARLREQFVRMTRHLYEMSFNGLSEEERYGRKEAI